MSDFEEGRGAARVPRPIRDAGRPATPPDDAGAPPAGAPSAGDGERGERAGRRRPTRGAAAAADGRPAGPEKGERRRQRPRSGFGRARRPANDAETDERPLPAEARVTAIVEQGRKEGRWVVQLEGVPSIVVSAEIIDRLAVRVGAVLTTPAIAALRDAGAALRTYDRALNLLAFRARSSTDLRRRLIEKGEPAAYADQAIERLTALGLLDDAAYARQFARGKVLGAGASRRRLQQELFRRGVARPLADEAIAEVLEDEAVDEDAIVERTARKKLRSLEKLDAPTKRRRLYAFLARRGYESDAIRRAMQTVLDTSDVDALDDALADEE